MTAQCWKQTNGALAMRWCGYEVFVLNSQDVSRDPHQL
jgi:hypothetical protein